MAKIGKVFATGILAAAAAAGTYYVVKNKDELYKRAMDLAAKLKNEDIEEDFDIEFEDFADFAQCEAEVQECCENAEEEQN